MKTRIRHIPIVFGIFSLVASCSGSDNGHSINSTLKDLIDVGYSVKELSVRTDYPEQLLIDAYLNESSVLEDSSKNAKIEHISDLNKEGKIIPINKTNISAYDGLWQIYTKAQNLPRTSLYTGIGVTKVACSLMKRKPISYDDSIRALVGYVNMKYELEDMPPSINKYFAKTSTINDVVVPTTFRPRVSDKTKTKIDYYLYQNEQFELRANLNLKKALDEKVDTQVKNSIDDFISEDVSSIINTARTFFKDSLEQRNFFREKLSERLAFEKLNQDIRDELITFCVSVNCSRAILINEILNYREIYQSQDIPNKKFIEDYIAKLEDITTIMEKQRDNLVIESGIIAIATILSRNPAIGATASLKIKSLVNLGQFIVVDALTSLGLESFASSITPYGDNNKIIDSTMVVMQNKIKKEISSNISKSMNGKGSYYELLDNNTKDYYNQVRNFFGIK